MKMIKGGNAEKKGMKYSPNVKAMAIAEKTIKCSSCNGTGRVPKPKKQRRMRCSECSDRGHGCYGSGNNSGLGYVWCTVDVEEESK